MRRRAIAIVAALAALLVSVVPVLAITRGQPDEGRHPNVGALVAPFDDVLGAYCSGTLISETVFLTAAHCGETGERVEVSFDEQVNNDATTHSGTFYANPGFNQAQSDSGDIAVVVLDEAITGIVPASLPTLNQLGEMKAAGQLKRQPFTAVGYGSQETKTGPGPHHLVYLDAREFAVGSYSALNRGYLRISQNPSTGDAGTCYGDSGGPNFLGAGASETDVIAAITITGDTWCRSTNVTYRLDTESARTFLAAYVTLP